MGFLSKYLQASQPGSPLFSPPSPYWPLLSPPPAAIADARKAMEEIEIAQPVVPVHKGDEPIRALKAAHLILTGSGVAFAPLNSITEYGRLVTYGPKAVSECKCTKTLDLAAWTLYGGSYRSAYDREYHNHPLPDHDTSCGFYAWKRHVEFPWHSGTWLLEVDLYGRVVEHELGYRAGMQRVLRISPVPRAFCEPPLAIGFALDDETAECFITARCSHDSHESGRFHPVSPERIRKLLNVEVDLNWATQMRDES